MLADLLPIEIVDVELGHGPLALDLDVDAGRQVELHQRVQRLLGGLEDVEQPLVGADLELLRLFLSTCGLRRTVNLLMRVGSGMGPATLAPVRLAVSTISPAHWSRSLESYALRRIRIF